MTLKRTVAKVTLDQLFYAPSQQTVILVTIGALQGFSLQQIGDKVQRELPTITFTGWKVSIMNTLNILLFTDLGSLIGNLDYGYSTVWKFSNVLATDFS